MQPGYRKLAMISVIHLIVMFLLTYTLLSDWEHFHVNVNRTYMGVLMVVPMVMIMPLAMGSMFPDKKLNMIIWAAGAAVFVGVFILARTQTPVGNGEFLRSMIPHHSSAVLMCREAQITDPEIATLCDKIVRAQLEEIAQMKAILARPH